VLRFPLPIFIPPNSPSSKSPGAGTIGHSVADVPSGPCWTPPPNMRIKKIHHCDKRVSIKLDTSEVLFRTRKYCQS
jgi:hypothetical protein